MRAVSEPTPHGAAGSAPQPLFGMPPVQDASAGGDRPVRRAPARRLDPEALLTGLNGPQRDAVTHAGSPLLIVAGGGSRQNPGVTPPNAHPLPGRGGPPRQ